MTAKETVRLVPESVVKFPQISHLSSIHQANDGNPEPLTEHEMDEPSPEVLRPVRVLPVELERTWPEHDCLYDMLSSPTVRFNTISAMSVPYSPIRLRLSRINLSSEVSSGESFCL